MRHFVGLILGIILVPAFFALNWLVNHMSAQAGSTPTRTWMLAMLGSYAAFGLVLGIVIAARSISAVALLLGGILIIAAEGLLALPKLASMQMNIPQVYDHPEITRTWLPLIAGAALLFAALMPSRWHRAHPEDELDPLGMRGDDAFDEDAQTTRTGSYYADASPRTVVQGQPAQPSGAG